MFELIYNIEQDMWGRSQIQITREKEEKRKEEVNNFLLGIFSLFLKDFRVAVFLILKLRVLKLNVNPRNEQRMPELLVC